MMLEAVNAARLGRIVPQKQTNRQHDHGKDYDRDHGTDNNQKVE